MDEGKVYYNVKDIMDRFGVSYSKALSIMRAVRVVNGKVEFFLKGKILASELEFWERSRMGRDKVAQ